MKAGACAQLCRAPSLLPSAALQSRKRLWPKQLVLHHMATLLPRMPPLQSIAS